MNLADLLFHLGLGGLTVFALVWFSQHFKNIGVKEWISTIIGVLLLTFSIAWAYASFAEAEPQAGVVGFVMFAVPAIILLALTRRFMVQS